MILHNATVDTILERRSVRSYAPQQITPDELETILEAGRSAPSGMNQQSAIAVAVQSKAELAQLVELAKAAEPDAPFYAVEALLQDGTCGPTTGASMSLNEESGMDEWSIQWVTPIDPETVVALIFSDGTSRQEIPMES